MAEVLVPPTFRRIVAIALLLVMVPVAYAGMACAGWSASAAERMACCERAGATCPSMSADDCCADGEQRKNLEAQTPVIITIGEITATPVAGLIQSLRPVSPKPVALGERPDPYLLDSVFLI